MRTVRFLVVDDNHDAAESLGMLLEFRGHQVHIAHDGASAVATAKAVRPEVVVLDIGLPVMDGYEVARQIRAQGDDVVQPVLVAATGWGQDEHRRRSAEAGFDAHIVKPIDEQTLLTLVEQLLQSRRARVDPPA